MGRRGGEGTKSWTWKWGETVEEGIQLAGERFEITRGRQAHAAQGRRNSRDRFIVFLPEADVKVGDILRSVASSEVFHVVNTDASSLDGRVYQIKAQYETQAQHDQGSRMMNPPLAHLSGAGAATSSPQQEAMHLFDEVRRGR